MNNRSKYVILEGIDAGNRFFTANTQGKDQTRLADGTVAYTVLGYANTIREAQIFLYGVSFTDSND
jgi:hypothetical protein